MMTFEEKSIESLSAGTKLLEEKKYNSCVNRAYYGMFQIILHKLDKNGQLSSVDIASKSSQQGTHNFTIDWYIDNILSKRIRMGQVILARRNAHTLKDLRHKADYSKEPMDDKLAKNALKHSQEFYDIVKNK